MRWPRLVPALLAVAATLPVTASPAVAAPGQAAAPSLQLVEQSAVTDPDGELVIRVRVADVPADASLEVRVFDRVRNRSEFARSIDGDGLHRELTSSQPELVSNLHPDAADTVTVRVQLRSASGGDLTRLRLTVSGVYPVELVLTDGDGKTLDSLITDLVRLPAPGDESPALAVAVLVPVHAAPALQPGGTTNLSDADRTGLTATAEAIADQPDVPLTVLPTPETVDALAQGVDPGDTAVLSTLRDGLVGRQLLAAPYVDIDLNAWVAAGLTDELSAELTRGGDLLTDQLARPDGRTWIADGPLTEAAIARLRAQGVDQIVVPEATLAPIDEGDFPVTLAQAFEVGSDPDRRVRAMMADAALTAHVGSTDDPVLDAHRLLADLATIYFDTPPQSRGCVVALPPGWVPSRAFLDALLEGLTDGRILEGTTIDTAFERVPLAATDGQVDSPRGGTPGSSADAPEPLIRAFVPTTPTSLGTFPSAAARVRRSLASFVSMIGPTNPRADPFEQRILVAGAQQLTADERAAYLDAVSSGIEAEVANIVLPATQTITLTARNGRVPLSLRNDAAYPVGVVVRLLSDKLEFPDNPGGVLDLQLPGGTTTRVEVPVRARASGDSSVDIAVMSPDGSLTLARSRFTVRSTAVSRVGVILSIGAGLFLLVWWGRNIRKTRRSKRLVAAQ